MGESAKPAKNGKSNAKPKTVKPEQDIRIGILTSGGDAQGMNAAVRSAVRSAIVLGAKPFAIREGWLGAVQGGSCIHELTWGDVSNTISKGGTIIGTARCPEFRDWEGRLKACENLVKNGIDRLISIGGDGSLRGTEELRQDWPKLLEQLVKEKRLSAAAAKAHPSLCIVCLLYTSPSPRDS